MSLHAIRVMFDTNILISAILNPAGVPNLALLAAAEFSYTIVICEQIIDETRRIFNRKFPSKIPDMERFIAVLRYDLITLAAEDDISADEKMIRDINDRPILRAGQKANVDILVTGDKDFLESNVTRPQIMTAAQFVQKKSPYKI